MYKSLQAAMMVGLNREHKIQCPDVNVNVRDSFRDFVAQQLNGSKLEHDFIDLKFVFNRFDSNDAIIPKGPVVLMSGGIDSVIALLYLLDVYKYQNITALFVHYGSSYNDAELIAFRKLQALFLKIGWHNNVAFREFTDNATPLDSSKFGAGYIIPLRNALLASYAVLFGDNIFLTANWRLNEHAGSGDKGITFFSQISELLSQQYMQPMRVWSPFLHWKKEQAVTWLMNRFPKSYAEILHTTMSCYNPTNGKACGECYACWKVARTFRTVNIWDMMQDKFIVSPFTTGNAKLWEQSEKEKGR